MQTPTPPRRAGLVALDIDGTLLERDASLPGDRADALARLVATTPTMLATGKTMPSITGLVERFAIPGPHAICNGAALVHGTDRVEVLAGLAPAVVDRVTDVLAERGVATAAYLDDGTIVSRTEDERFHVITDLGEPQPRVGTVDGHTVLKVIAVIAPHEEGDLRSLCADTARVQRTGPLFLEWNAPEASKGVAVAHVAGLLGVSMADVVAVGDSENDVPMLDAAGWGVAVADSTDAAVDAADEHLEVDVAVLLDRLAGA